ncbi:MAG: methionyl-tRNA formyltransferase, partial [Candidatus Taylorbacteria bacterium]|nr:methionyl-tRNA formyltransferase [Candidatus Taylorbacteria bacterium]
MKNQALNKISPGTPKKDLQIVFFGTSDFAVPALKSLLNFGYNVTAVVTQPEKPVGRARVIMPSPVKKVAFENHIPVLEPHTLKDDETFKRFKHLNPDICIVTAYGKIIPSRYLDISRFGFLNIHPSLLPKYRGPSPIQTAIMNGDTETGVTIM